MASARVLIDGPSELVFDYAIPAGMAVAPGCRVRVPLRARTATGTVLDIVGDAQGAFDFKLREIASLSDPEPLVTPVLLRIGRWIADYYGSRMETVMRALLPEAVRTEEHSAKVRRIAVLSGDPPDDELAALVRRAARQHAIVSLLMAAPDRRMPVADLGKGAAASLRGLVKRGWVEIAEETVQRDPDATGMEVVESSPLALTDEQATALGAILEALPHQAGDGEPENRGASADAAQIPEPPGEAPGPPPKPILLHGVTGSGKTEVYLQAAARTLELGRTVLVLVPEISLTPQTVRRFRARFAAIHGQVAVLHSHLSQGERFDEWHRIRTGGARIVIGARSAVFAPLPDLGLIVVDEEHETSYKQDTAPRYNGRDVAVLRAAFERCAIVLGSATPSLESFHNTQTGKYRLLRLSRRADERKMPLIRVVDMRLESRKRKGALTILSDRLRSELEDKLSRGEQAILFLNRRGFARSLQCPACGHVCTCPHCAVSLTYHRTDERLVCHVCGYQAIVPRRCPECNDPAIAMHGYGTQKVEDVLKKLIPKAKIARIDADAARRKHALRDMLNAFKARKIDILIGTQMIAKGLHFPNVTLVGILNADLSLHIPDFRAGERTFQLLVQVAGRAGRGELEGEVVIQTFTPHSPSIQFARHHDFEGFSEQELEFRRQFGYPPYSHCAVLTARSTHERRAEFTLQTLLRRLKENLPAGIVLGEVIPSPLVRAHGQFRFQIVMRAPKSRPLSRHVQQVLDKNPLPDDVTVTFDMDAINFS